MNKKIMTARELVARAAKANLANTLYVKGGWGQLATAKNKAKAIALYPYNKAHAADINEAAYKTWFFDCVCFIKGLLWGWNDNYGDSNGGAVYASNGVPDCTEKGLLNLCGEHVYNFNDKSHLVPGAILYMSGHVGIYVGENKVIECYGTPGVCVTSVNRCQWLSYGLLECIDYQENTPAPAPEPPTIEKGTKIILNNAPLYASSTRKTPANHVTGYFYLSDGIDFHGRYRICKDRFYCGAINKVLGYVRKEDIKCVPR